MDIKTYAGDHSRGLSCLRPFFSVLGFRVNAKIECEKTFCFHSVEIGKQNDNMCNCSLTHCRVRCFTDDGLD